jgi:hypothetical protein
MNILHPLLFSSWLILVFCFLLAELNKTKFALAIAILSLITTIVYVIDEKDIFPSTLWFITTLCWTYIYKSLRKF